MNDAAAHDFALGRSLGRAISVWIKNLVPFLILSTIVYAPIFLYAYLGVAGHVDATSRGFDLTLRIGGMLLEFALGATLIYGVLMQLRGQHAPLGKCITVGLGRVFPVFGVAIVVGLLVGLGTLALIVPGLIFACMCYVAVPVAVIEKPGVFASVKRSRELTEGYRMQIFGLVVLVFGLEWLLTFAITRTMLETPMVLFWMLLAQSVVTGSFGAVLSGVVYNDLREAKEGTHAEDLARIFD